MATRLHWEMIMDRRSFLTNSAFAIFGANTAPLLTGSSLADEGSLPEFAGAVDWLNSAPLTHKSLRGKVVLVNFWTYSCINSLRPLPYLKNWAARYKDAGLVVIGVHTPEFEFEKERANVERAIHDLKIAYPVPMDSNYRIWRAFNNSYWPAFYLVDAKGRIRYHHFGEGEYGESERVLQSLLKENGASGWSGNAVPISSTGAEVAPGGDVRSPETYIGYRQAERFSSPERMAHDSHRTYSPPVKPRLNQWGLSGSWEVGPQHAALLRESGRILFRFHSRDLHLVLGPSEKAKPVRFRVTLEGSAPGADAGTDTAPDGAGEVLEPRLYQLVRQKSGIKDRDFAIEFLDPGVRAFSFTFG